MTSTGLPDDVELDTAIRPQDDFYRFVNGRWIEAFTLPEHRAEATMLSLLSAKVQDEVAAQIEGLVAEPDLEHGASDRQIASLYASFMDEDRIEQRGSAVFEPGLKIIRSISSRDELAYAVGKLQSQGAGGVVEFSVSTNTAQADQYVLALSQGGLGLPSAAMYRQVSHVGLREQYLAHMQSMLGHAGLEDPAAAAASVLRLEIELASGHVLPGADGRVSAAPAICSAAELAARTSGFAWAQWLRGLGTVPAEATVSVRPPEFLGALDAWWQSHDLDEFQLWLAWRYLHEMVPFGPRKVFADNFAFYGQVLNGLTQPRPRRIRAVSLVETFLGHAAGQRYLAEYLAHGAVDAATRLVEALVRSYRRRLEGASWVQEKTRAAALRKLDGMVFEIGSPRNSDSYEEMQIDSCDLIGNVTRGRQCQIMRDIARLGTEVDRSEWKIHPQQVTAYYRHGLNQVVIPAAMLQPPLFAADGDMARNFAMLGSIICHEMSHAFDSRGSRYDELGRVRNWWVQEDRGEFARRTALLVSQYDKYEPQETPGRNVSGARTLGENIADVVGLTVAQGAFADYLAGQPGAVDDQTNTANMRRFFICWASMWRAKCTRDRMRERLVSDSHAPAEFRCNGALGHIDEFYRAFDVQPGDNMYISPDNRFTLL